MHQNIFSLLSKINWFEDCGFDLGSELVLKEIEKHMEPKMRLVNKASEVHSCGAVSYNTREWENES